MKCAICGGRTKQGTTTVTIDRGRQVLVIRDVPAKVCSMCGESWMDDGSAEAVEAVVDRAGKEKAQVEVVSLATA